MAATGNGSDTGPVVVPVRVEAETSSLDAMRAKLRAAEEQLTEVRGLAKYSTNFDIHVEDATRNVKALTAEIRGLEKANKSAEAAAKEQGKAAVTAYKFQQKAAADADKAAAAGIKGLFGTSVFELGASKIAAAFGKGAQETKAIEGALMQGGEALASGAAMAATAALAIGAAGVGLVTAGIKYGIENTAQRQKNQAVLDKLTRGQGVEAEEFSKALAGETGVSEDKAMERVKALIQAKFGKEDTGAIFRASADIGEVKGEAKAELFLKTLEKIQFEGAATEKSVKALEGAGVDKGQLLAGLAKAGETTEQVAARLKAGKVAADEFARAAAAVVQKDIGGVAGKGLDAMVNRLKIGFGDLFDDFDLGPLESLGGLLSSALSGKDGAALKESISAAGSSVLALAKNVTAADIKGLFSAAASAATTLAAGITEAAGAAGKLWNFAKQVSGSGSHMEAGSSGDATGDAIEAEINAGNRRAFIREQEIEKAKAAAEKVKAAQEAAAPSGGGAKDQAAAGGYNAGKALADGVAKGIEDNAGKPAGAASQMMAGTIAAGDQKAKIKSPSKVMEERGDYIDEGLAGGIETNAWKPAGAAGRALGRTVGAGPVGGGLGFGGGGATASAPGAVYHFSPVVNVQGGGPDVRDQLNRALLAAYPGWLALQRQNERDNQERRLPAAVPQ